MSAMSLRDISDDFFSIGEIAVLDRTIGNDRYDFPFRNLFNCHSIVATEKKPVLLHIGALEDYEGIAKTLNEIDMKLLVSVEEHNRCSTIEGWYPVIKKKTPFTRVYDSFPQTKELLRDFSFPVFIKGNRQTNRHIRSQCIITNSQEYEALQAQWCYDPILSWQKVAIREYVHLQVIDANSFPDMIPISYEFRFFYFGGKCMAYGPYWGAYRSYSLSQDDLKEALHLTDWVAECLDAKYLAIDIAKTASGEWIVIEVNDAQESGFVGVDPYILWNNTISAMQNNKTYNITNNYQK